MSADTKTQNFLLWVDKVPYDQIKTGYEQLHGLFRFTDEHYSENRIKKSIYKVVLLEPGKEKEEVPIEISYNTARKAAMIAIKSAAGKKQQRSEVVMKKRMEEAFPLNMLENNHGWKLTARLPQDRQGTRNFDLIINELKFLGHDFVPQDHDDYQTLKGIIKINENFFLDEK